MRAPWRLLPLFLISLTAALLLAGCPSSPPGTYILDLHGQMDGEADGVGDDVGADAVTEEVGPDTGVVCEPEPEVCDNEDNDCDGLVDEDFKLGEWYFGADNCGACGVTCAVENGAAFCSLSVTPPECFVSDCDPGYISPDGKTCVPAGGLACVPCETDDECAEGICTTLETAKYCFPRCPPGCPEGYECVADGDDLGVCDPISGSCECTPETLGQLRGCQNLNENGACLGQEICTEAGWGLCDAAVPLAEECNGIDENCNDLIDEGLPEDDVCVNTVPGLGSCVGVNVCEGFAGWICNAADPMPEICDYEDNDCDGDVDDGFKDLDTGLYTGDLHCGLCDNDCTILVFPNASGACVVTDGVGPGCAMVCDPGWVDTDGAEENGCECPFISDEDPPDGVDQNCDGIDGEPDNAIFVSVTGADGNPGTPELPVRTVAKGIERAENAGKEHVYVTHGDFSGGARLHEGVRVFCGFQLDFAVRDFEANESVLIAGVPTPDAPGTVTAVAVGLGAATTSIEGCTIMGPIVMDPGASAYTLYVRDAGPGLRIADNLIHGGQGANAETGDPGDHGSDGNAGQGGEWAYDVGWNNSCTASNAQPGGNGGAKTCSGISVAGGPGGTSICPDHDEWGAVDSCPVEEHQTPSSNEQGDAGVPAAKGGPGGMPGLDSIHTVMDNGMFCGWDTMNCSYCHVALGGSGGQNGKNGSAGANGSAGGGCSQQGGAVTAGLWTPAGSSGGGAGAYGGGGGGGGAAGGVEGYGCEETNQGSDVGGSGGGGGGGCGGPAVGLFVSGPAAASQAAQAALPLNSAALDGAAGSPGAGGYSKGNDGAPGTAGLHAALHTL